MKLPTQSLALSTFFVTSLAFLFAALIAGVFADICLPEALGTEQVLSQARERREDYVGWTALAGGFVGAVFTGWAWRSSVSVRFHSCFWCGLGMLCLALVYVWHITKITIANTERYDVWIAPLLSTFITSLGLVLLLTALILDGASASSSRRRKT